MGNLEGIIQYKNLEYGFYEKFEKVVGTSEANLIYHVVGPFLERLGYKREWHELEPRSHNRSRKFVDLYINDRKGNQLVIEVKKSTKQLTKDDLSQLDTYLKDKNCHWGILTNGNEWILVNRTIKGNNDNLFGNQTVFHIKLNHRKKGDFHPEKIEYFSYKSLFDKHGITNYFRDLQQFKVYQYNGNDRSWSQFKSAVNHLIQYLIFKNEGYYANLQSYQFKDFLRWCVKKETAENKAKESYLRSRFRFLNAFYTNLSQDGTFNNNPLSTIDIKDLLNELEDIIADPSNNEEEDIHEVIQKTFEFMSSKRDAIRNKLIFSLMIFGLDREEIVSLKWDDIIDDKKTNKKKYLIVTGKRKRKLPLDIIPKIRGLLESYELQLKNKGIRKKWMVCKSNGEPLSYYAIDYIINQQGIRKVSKLSIEQIQQYIIKTLLRETKDLFTILYLRDLNLGQIESLLEWKDIEQNSDFKKLVKKHPFQDILI